MDKKLTTLGVKIDAQTKHDLKVYAEKLGWSSSKLAAEIIRDYTFKCSENPLEIYKMIGLDLINAQRKTKS